MASKLQSGSQRVPLCTPGSTKHPKRNKQVSPSATHPWPDMAACAAWAARHAPISRRRQRCRAGWPWLALGCSKALQWTSRFSSRGDVPQLCGRSHSSSMLSHETAARIQLPGRQCFWAGSPSPTSSILANSTVHVYIHPYRQTYLLTCILTGL